MLRLHALSRCPLIPDAAMTQTQRSTPDDTEVEYRAIEQTLLQNARGRWFLAEHGRRARRLDTHTLEHALQQLQSSLREPPALLGQLKSELEGLQTLLGASRDQARAKAGAAEAGGTAPSAHGILKAAEDIHELAWTMQAEPPSGESAERIARNITHLYALTLQQAHESDRIKKLLTAIEQAGERIEAVLETIAHETHALDETSPLPESN
jgi:hypothetical protein